ncbi:hypothetical protein GCM10027176_48470 [Actinoallomurus bryophytorum]|uniref:hypothetical protein n=1 Tax=Actinoallomurus bryophytorum TaxID=1490222 RepID=UPI0011504282|nr:hypothetical protein [Actinoallomurus bryophytorum]
MPHEPTHRRVAAVVRAVTGEVGVADYAGESAGSSKTAEAISGSSKIVRHSCVTSAQIREDA